MKKSIIPKVGEIYNYFDDGKVTESRRGSVLITEVISFNGADQQMLLNWRENASDCYWLYSKNTDFFVKGDLDTNIGYPIEPIVFVRTVDGGWFSLGWWAGRLDVDGVLNKKLEEYILKYKNDSEL